MSDLLEQANQRVVEINKAMGDIEDFEIQLNSGKEEYCGIFKRTLRNADYRKNTGRNLPGMRY